MKMLIFILIFNISSCASSDWYEVGVGPSKQTWRHCSEIDNEYYLKGHCYKQKICKGSIFKKCKVVTKFCKWGDIDCMRKYKILQKVLVNEKN